MAWIASLRCVVCGAWPVEVAHVGARAYGQKCSDRETLPLCPSCHREGPQALHKLGRRFWETHGLDSTELVGQFNAAYNSLA
jgi:hypothetical protein